MATPSTNPPSSVPLPQSQSVIPGTDREVKSQPKSPPNPLNAEQQRGDTAATGKEETQDAILPLYYSQFVHKRGRREGKRGATRGISEMNKIIYVAYAMAIREYSIEDNFQYTKALTHDIPEDLPLHHVMKDYNNHRAAIQQDPNIPGATPKAKLLSWMLRKYGKHMIKKMRELKNSENGMILFGVEVTYPLLFGRHTRGTIQNKATEPGEISRLVAQYLTDQEPKERKDVREKYGRGIQHIWMNVAKFRFLYYYQKVETQIVTNLIKHYRIQLRRQEQNIDVTRGRPPLIGSHSPLPYSDEVKLAYQHWDENFEAAEYSANDHHDHIDELPPLLHHSATIAPSQSSLSSGDQPVPSLAHISGGSSIIGSSSSSSSSSNVDDTTKLADTTLTSKQQDYIAYRAKDEARTKYLSHALTGHRAELEYYAGAADPSKRIRGFQITSTTTGKQWHCRNPECKEINRIVAMVCRKCGWEQYYRMHDDLANNRYNFNDIMSSPNAIQATQEDSTSINVAGDTNNSERIRMDIRPDPIPLPSPRRIKQPTPSISISNNAHSINSFLTTGNRWQGMRSKKKVPVGNVRQQLRARGLILVENAGGGYCLFLSVLDQLGDYPTSPHSDESKEDLHQGAVDALKAKACRSQDDAKTWITFIRDTDLDYEVQEPNLDGPDWKRNMQLVIEAKYGNPKEEDQWPDEMVILSLCDYLGMNIKIWSPEFDKTLNPATGPAAITLNVGYINNQHYLSVRLRSWPQLSLNMEASTSAIHIANSSTGVGTSSDLVPTNDPLKPLDDDTNNTFSSNDESGRSSPGIGLHRESVEPRPMETSPNPLKGKTELILPTYATSLEKDDQPNLAPDISSIIDLGEERDGNDNMKSKEDNKDNNYYWDDLPDDTLAIELNKNEFLTTMNDDQFVACHTAHHVMNQNDDPKDPIRINVTATVNKVQAMITRPVHPRPRESQQSSKKTTGGRVTSTSSNSSSSSSLSPNRVVLIDPNEKRSVGAEEEAMDTGSDEEVAQRFFKIIASPHLTETTSNQAAKLEKCFEERTRNPLVFSRAQQVKVANLVMNPLSSSPLPPQSSTQLSQSRLRSSKTPVPAAAQTIPPPKPMMDAREANKLDHYGEWSRNRKREDYRRRELGERTRAEQYAIIQDVRRRFPPQSGPDLPPDPLPDSPLYGDNIIMVPAALFNHTPLRGPPIAPIDVIRSGARFVYGDTKPLDWCESVFRHCVLHSDSCAVLRFNNVQRFKDQLNEYERKRDQYSIKYMNLLAMSVIMDQIHIQNAFLHGMHYELPKDIFGVNGLHYWIKLPTVVNLVDKNNSNNNRQIWMHHTVRGQFISNQIGMGLYAATDLRRGMFYPIQFLMISMHLANSAHLKYINGVDNGLAWKPRPGLQNTVGSYVILPSYAVEYYVDPTNPGASRHERLKVPIPNHGYDIVALINEPREGKTANSVVHIFGPAKNSVVANGPCHACLLITEDIKAGDEITRIYDNGTDFRYQRKDRENRDYQCGSPHRPFSVDELNQVNARYRKMISIINPWKDMKTTISPEHLGPSTEEQNVPGITPIIRKDLSYYPWYRVWNEFHLLNKNDEVYHADKRMQGWHQYVKDMALARQPLQPLLGSTETPLPREDYCPQCTIM